MPKLKSKSYYTSSYSRRLPLRDISSKGNIISKDKGAKNLCSKATDDEITLCHRALLAEARAGDENLPPQFVDLRKYRGEGFPLWYRMELVEIYRYLRQQKDTKVTPSNFHKFVKIDIHRDSITSWDKDFEKIKYDVAHGRGNKCRLSSDQSTLIRFMVGRAVNQWLVEVRKENGIISGRKLQATADSIFHVLVDDIAPDEMSLGRPISFTAAWRTEMKEEYCIASFSLKGESGSVDINAIEPRMAEIRRICSKYDPDDIYNCDETGMYLLEVHNRSFSIPEYRKAAKPTRGTGTRVSILFCINATGSSLTREAEIPALRPLIIGKRYTSLLYY